MSVENNINQGKLVEESYNPDRDIKNIKVGDRVFTRYGNKRNVATVTHLNTKYGDGIVYLIDDNGNRSFVNPLKNPGFRIIREQSPILPETPDARSCVEGEKAKYGNNPNEVPDPNRGLTVDQLEQARQFNESKLLGRKNILGVLDAAIEARTVETGDKSSKLYEEGSLVVDPLLNGHVTPEEGSRLLQEA